MIRVTRFDGKLIMLNAEWIQTVESTPDTLITLTTGFTLIVRDSLDEVVEAYKRYKRETIGIKVIQRNVTAEPGEIV
jgi:flagellar protein FlbD